jgi:disulfide bond formation protein DsbB
MHNLRVETFIKIIFLISLVSIISAYFIEYILGHQPCNLCLIERIPYGLALVLITLNHILIKNKRFTILLLILVFTFSLIISFYHFGIEQGIFTESTVCGLKDASNIVSKEELLKQLQIKNVSCKDVTFRIFGFSLTSFNIIVSLILVILLSKVFKNYEKFKK